MRTVQFIKAIALNYPLCKNPVSGVFTMVSEIPLADTSSYPPTILTYSLKAVMACDDDSCRQRLTAASPIPVWLRRERAITIKDERIVTRVQLVCDALCRVHFNGPWVPKTPTKVCFERISEGTQGYSAASKEVGAHRTSIHIHRQQPDATRKPGKFRTSLATGGRKIKTTRG